jgi:hypothetical protein
MTDWSDMSTRGLLLQCTSTIKKPTKWFSMKYIWKYLRVERHLIHDKCMLNIFFLTLIFLMT